MAVKTDVLAKTARDIAARSILFPGEKLLASNRDDIEVTTDGRKTAIVVVTSVLVAIFSLLSLASPDGRSTDDQLHNNIKPGEQLKDVATYCKQHNLSYQWDAKTHKLAIIVNGAKWLPIVKVTYKTYLYFDDFNQYKSGRTGNMEYSMR